MRPAGGWLVAHADLVSVLLIGIAMIRIVSTLTIFSATTDEPLHVTAGVQFVQDGTYAWQLENPPLPRVVFGWLITQGGARFDPSREMMDMMKWLFYSSGHYKTSLFLARAGNLVFFIIAATGTWWLARRALGRSGGAIATLLFTTQPVILGLAGIANLDTAAVAGVALALVAFWRWVEKPVALRALLAGVAFGFSIGLKLSNFLFTAAACFAIYVVYFATDSAVRRAWRNALVALPLAAIGAFCGLWATYGFALGTYDDFGIMKPPPMESPVARILAPIDAATKIPMPHFFAGVSALSALDRAGHLSYAFGKTTTEGWWWYFPAALVFKTTLTTLILALAGFFVARGRFFIAMMAATVAILIPAMPAKLDLGIRYVLPLYIPLSIGAAATALVMLRHVKRAVRLTAVVLLAWQCAASLLAHPDYFPYFNELAGPRPGRLFIDSNLDWGQDMLRLRRVLREKNVEKVGIFAVGLHDYDELGFPPSTRLHPYVPFHGWVVVSEHMYRMIVPDGGFFWLHGRPYRRIGRSLRLYYVP